MSHLLSRAAFSLLMVLSPVLADAEPNQLHRQVLGADVVVLDQFGQQKHFYTDLIKNQKVAINFIFTSCRSSCPLSTSIFRQVQTKLGQRQVHLITISVDPAVDSSERLLEFSHKFKAGPGWSFITGEKNALDGLLKTLGVFSADKSLHTNQVIVGNDLNGQWTRLYGLPNVNAIVSALQRIAD